MAALAILVIVAGAVFVARLTHGPIVLDGVGPRIAAALDARFGRGFDFTVGETALTQQGYGPALTIADFSVTGDDGQLLLSAPRAEMSLDPLALLFGNVSPRRLELFNLELHLVMQPDGSVAISATPGARPAVAARPLDVQAPPAAGAAATEAGRPPGSIEMRQASAAIRLLIEGLTNPSSPMAAVERIGISRGRLIVEDPTTDQRSVYEDLDLSFDRSSGISAFHLAATGPSRRWSVDATADGTPTTDRHLHIQAKNLSLDEIMLLAGTRSAGADFDMPIESGIDFGLTPQGTLSEASGSMDFGAGYLRFDDPDSEPLMIDSAGVRFHWEAASRRIVVDDAAMHMGGTHFAIAGAITPPRAEGASWQIELDSHGANAFGPERPDEQPIPIDTLTIRAEFDKVGKRLLIDRVAMSGPQAGIALSGQLEWQNGPHLKLEATLDPTPARTVIRVWPSFLVAQVRAWFLSHFTGGIVQSGHLKVDLDADTLAAMRAERPAPDAAIAIDFAFTGARLNFLPGVPPLAGMDGNGHVTGRTSTVNVASAFLDAGSGRRIMLSDGTFHVPDSAIKPTPATIAAHLTGPVEAVASLLARDAIKPYASLPLDPTTVKGQSDAHVGIDLKLGPGSGPDDIGIHVNALLTSFVADKLVGKEKLDAATIALTVDPAGMKATGQGRLFGAPAQLDITKPTNKPGEASMSFVLDEAARAKQGFGNISGLSGPIGAHVVMPIGVDKPKAQVELDLTKTGLDGVLPGIYKPAGRPGKVSFVASLGETTTTLDQIVIDMGSIQAHGSVDLGADQTLLAAKFPLLKISPGDDMHLEAVKAGDALKLTIHATAIDARPFLKPFTFASGEAKPAAPASSSGSSLKDAPLFKDMDLELKTALLSGYNKQVLSGVELRLAKHDDQLRQFAMNGHFGHDSISGSLTGGGGPGAPQLDMTTADAGGLLGFVDLYRHMEGGHLAVTMRLGEGGLAGSLDIKDFTLRDEPALRRLVAEGRPPHTAGEETSTPIQTIDASAVAFNRLQVRFQRVGDRLDLHDGVMYGPAIGLSVDGQLDFAHDRVNMNGTFVPAYAVNNLFSQIPLFGLLLGGGSHEGLFAVDYRITGLASAPTLNINPLSAIAPGILRKIFGALDPGAQPPPAGAPAPPSAAEGK